MLKLITYFVRTKLCIPAEMHKLYLYYIYTTFYICIGRIQGVPRDFSNHPQESRWNRNKHKSSLPFSDICNNNRDINVCNCY